MSGLPRIAITACFAIMLGLSACSFDQNKPIIDRVVSPDRKREAIYAEDRSGGATVGSTQEVFVVERGAPLRIGNRVAALERACRLSIRWQGNNLIEISYFAAREKQDRSLWKSVAVDVRYRWLGRDIKNGC